MILPNKFFSFKDSILAKLNILILEDGTEIEISKLFEKNRKKFEGVEEFIDALDVLYALKKIELDRKDGVIRYVN